MRVFADRTSENPSIYNVQLASWKIAVERWERLEQRREVEGCEFNEFFEEATVILVLAGTSVSQLLGQQVANCGNKVPSVKTMLAEQISDVELRTTLNEFDSLYEDLRHFGEPKHPSVLDIDGPTFTKCMLAAQSAWVLIGKPGETTESRWFRNRFDVEWIDDA